MKRFQPDERKEERRKQYTGKRMSQKKTATITKKRKKTEKQHDLKEWCSSKQILCTCVCKLRVSVTLEYDILEGIASADIVKKQPISCTKGTCSISV